MSIPTQLISTKPYLVRAIYEWCTDNGFTPYVAVFVNAAVRVPMEYVKNNEIVLNVSFDATQNLKIDNEMLRFQARFAGTARQIEVPVDNIVAIYARENGQGMAFPLTPELQSEQAAITANIAPTAASGEGKQAGETQSASTNEATASGKNKPAASKARLSSVKASSEEEKAAGKRLDEGDESRAKRGKPVVHEVKSLPEQAMVVEEAAEPSEPLVAENAAPDTSPVSPEPKDEDPNPPTNGGKRPALTRIK